MKTYVRTRIAKDNVSGDDIKPLHDATGIADKIAFASEQRNDPTLAHAFELARSRKGNYYVCNDLLYRKEFCCGRELNNVVVPKDKRLDVLRLAHNEGHFGGKRAME